jgi:hypothetical protein
MTLSTKLRCKACSAGDQTHPSSCTLITEHCPNKAEAVRALWCVHAAITRCCYALVPIHCVALLDTAHVLLLWLPAVCLPGFGGANCAQQCGGVGVHATYGPAGRSLSPPAGPECVPCSGDGKTLTYSFHWCVLHKKCLVVCRY